MPFGQKMPILKRLNGERLWSLYGLVFRKLSYQIVFLFIQFCLQKYQKLSLGLTGSFKNYSKHILSQTRFLPKHLLPRHYYYSSSLGSGWIKEQVTTHRTCHVMKQVSLWIMFLIKNDSWHQVLCYTSWCSNVYAISLIQIIGNKWFQR